jgi:hypothetical protein
MPTARLSMASRATSGPVRLAALTPSADDPADEGPAQVDDYIRQYVRSCVWVSDAQRKRCTYLPAAHAAGGELVPRI